MSPRPLSPASSRARQQTAANDGPIKGPSCGLSCIARGIAAPRAVDGAWRRLSLRTGVRRVQIGLGLELAARPLASRRLRSKATNARRETTMQLGCRLTAERQLLLSRVEPAELNLMGGGGGGRRRREAPGGPAQNRYQFNSCPSRPKQAGSQAEQPGWWTTTSTATTTTTTTARKRGRWCGWSKKVPWRGQVGPATEEVGRVNGDKRGGGSSGRGTTTRSRRRTATTRKLSRLSRGESNRGKEKESPRRRRRRRRGKRRRSCRRRTKKT